MIHCSIEVAFRNEPEEWDRRKTKLYERGRGAERQNPKPKYTTPFPSLPFRKKNYLERKNIILIFIIFTLMI